MDEWRKFTHEDLERRKKLDPQAKISDDDMNINVICGWLNFVFPIGLTHFE